MNHYLMKKHETKLVRVLCSQAWTIRPAGQLLLREVDCPECLKMLIEIHEKRLAILKGAESRIKVLPC